MAGNDVFKKMIQHIYTNWKAKNFGAIASLYDEKECVGLLCGKGPQKGNQQVLGAYNDFVCDIDNRTVSVDVIEKGGAYLVVVIGKAKPQGMNETANFTHSLLVSVNNNNPCIRADIFSIVEKEQKSTNEDFLKMMQHLYGSWQSQNLNAMGKLYDNGCMGIFGTSAPTQGEEVIKKYGTMKVKFDPSQIVSHALNACGAFLVYSKGVMMLEGQTNPLSFAHILLCNVQGQEPKILLDIFKPVY